MTDLPDELMKNVF